MFRLDSWHRMEAAFIHKRRSLATVMLLLDCRRGITKLDQDMIDVLEHAGVNYQVRSMCIYMCVCVCFFYECIINNIIIAFLLPSLFVIIYFFRSFFLSFLLSFFLSCSCSYNSFDDFATRHVLSLSLSIYLSITHSLSLVFAVGADQSRHDDAQRARPADQEHRERRAWSRQNRRRSLGRRTLR